MHAASEALSGEKPIQTTLQDHVACIEMRCGRKGNAFNGDVIEDVLAAVQDLAARDARVLIIRGGDRRPFGSGMDLNELRTLTPAVAQTHFDLLNRCLDAIEAAPMATIAMVRGYAVGGGCELAAACDLRIAESSARIGIPIGRIGHCLDRENLRRLLRLLPASQIKAMIMTDQLLSAAEAQRIGFFNWVVPEIALESFTETLARTIAGKSPLGLRTLKRAIAEVLDGSVAHDADPEKDLITSLLATQDFQEGVAAFLERRTPVFQGR